MVSRRAVFALVALLFVLVLAGCSSVRPAPPGYYRIRSGDTLSEIARRYRVGYRTLARWNRLGPPYRIYAGSLLRIKPPRGKVRSTNRGARRTAKRAKRSRARGRAAARASTRATRRAADKRAQAASGLRWRWPLGGQVVQRFRRGDRTQQGIRIAGRSGQKVVAAESGTVVYSNSGLKSYGNLVIIRHANGYLSAYGFNRRLLVREGARVKRGQGIAEVGQASDGTYRLHFEIRRKGTPVDPLRYLP